MSGENRASGMRVERGAFREHVLIYRGHGVSREFQRSKPKVVLEHILYNLTQVLQGAWLRGARYACESSRCEVDRWMNRQDTRRVLARER
jgi:hypothetical protein